MLALATTREGDVPLFCQSLDGNASDKVSLVAAVVTLAAQLRASASTEEEVPISVADSGLYCAENVARLNAAGVRWISRVPETSTEAQIALAVPDDAWRQEGERFWTPAALAPAGARWVVVRTTQGEARAQASVQRQVEQTRPEWERQLWHLSNRRFACQPDAEAALAQHLKSCPAWLEVQAQVVAHPRYARSGRPRQGRVPVRQEWQVVTAVRVNETEVARQVRRRAAFLVATNVTDPQELPDHELIQTYKDQGSVERGFAFLKDPLFLASSVFVKKWVCRQRHLIG
jgi:transposase